MNDQSDRGKPFCPSRQNGQFDLPVRAKFTHTAPHHFHQLGKMVMSPFLTINKYLNNIFGPSQIGTAEGQSTNNRREK